LKFLIIFISLSIIYADDGLSYLNKIRTNVGLINLKPNYSLKKASHSHAKYLLRHQVTGHSEQRGRALYTGDKAYKRALVAGYPSAFVMENLTINTSNARESIDNLLSAIYHRFVFLTPLLDEIGISMASSPKGRRFNRVFVYDLGSSALSQICQKSYPKKNGQYYIRDICKDSSNMIPQSLYDKSKNDIALQNHDIILFPYPNQKEVSPVFYNESPDPLPSYKVSGYPISVELNPAYYADIKLKSFRLYRGNKEIKDTKILDYRSDINKIFTKSQFALMPLKRLEYGTLYSVRFEAIADKKVIKKSWQFRTIKPKGKLYRITPKRTHLKVKANSEAVFYFVPRDKNDIITRYGSTRELKVSYIDQNTFRVKFSKKKSTTKAILDLGHRKVTFDIE